MTEPELIQRQREMLKSFNGCIQGRNDAERELELKLVDDMTAANQELKEIERTQLDVEPRSRAQRNALVSQARSRFQSTQATISRHKSKIESAQSWVKYDLSYVLPQYTIGLEVSESKVVGTDSGAQLYDTISRLSESVSTLNKLRAQIEHASLELQRQRRIQRIRNRIAFILIIVFVVAALLGIIYVTHTYWGGSLDNSTTVHYLQEKASHSYIDPVNDNSYSTRVPQLIYANPDSRLGSVPKVIEWERFHKLSL